MTDDLETTYCSCNIEGRGVELTTDGIYTCVLCGNEIFVDKQWSPRTFNKHTTTLKTKNHALNTRYNGDLYENKE